MIAVAKHAPKCIPLFSTLIFFSLEQAVSRKESSQSTYEQRRRKACVKGVRDKVANVVDSTWAQNIITALVVLNAILIGIETDYGPTGFYCEGGTEGHDCNEDSMMAAFYVDTVIVGIFNLEIVLKRKRSTHTMFGRQKVGLKCCLCLIFHSFCARRKLFQGRVEHFRFCGHFTVGYGPCAGCRSRH